jgi:hypothetical protein
LAITIGTLVGGYEVTARIGASVPDGATLYFNAREGSNTSVWMLTRKDKKVTDSAANG